ncbi:MAG: PAS domain-containing protein [Gemmatimonadales bacterium]|nr:PAS domain-containing protein [Gemmatimonadales bacterium]
MPLDFTSQVQGVWGHKRLKLLKGLFLFSMGMAIGVSALFLGINNEIKPSPSRLGVRINYNITSAHLWTMDLMRGEGDHNQKDIAVVFDRVECYVKVALEGGEIEGIKVPPIDSPQLRMEMEEIGRLVAQMKNLTFDYIEGKPDSRTNAAFEENLEAVFGEFVNVTTKFTKTSSRFSLRNQHKLRVVQFIFIFLGMGLATSILIISRIAEQARERAWNLVHRIEEQRKLALEGANLGTWDWNVATGSLIINDRWAEMLGLAAEDIEPHFNLWEKLVHPDDAPLVVKELEKHLAGDSPRLFVEYRMMSESGQWIWVLDLGKVMEWDVDGKPLRAAGTHLDITDLKTTELALRAEKERAQKYLDLAGALFIAIDTKGVVNMVNRKGCQVLGLPEKDIVGRNWMENFVPDRYRHQTQGVSNGLMTDKANNAEYFENPVLTASGGEALISWHNSPLLDDAGQVVGHLSSGTDITNQRAHEAAVKKYQRRLQSLASQLALAEENLRQEIASGLHDSIGQNLAALKLSVDMARLDLGRESLRDSSGAQQTLEQVSRTIDEIVKEIWSLAFQLCPPGLQEAGIVSALEWLVGRYNDDYDCTVRLAVESSSWNPGRETRGLIFQMIRELMINAVKHGAATELEVSLCREENFLLATVTDNGGGFDVETTMAASGKAAGFGLFSIRERLAFISGKFNVESTIGRGTRVELSFPLEKAEGPTYSG